MNRDRAFLPFSALMLGCSALVCSLVFQSGAEPVERFRVRNWQTDEGLPQNPVWAITQTPDGYLWVGTQQGLVRFDGMRFIGLPEGAPLELKHGFISALCASPDGTLWIGCDNAGLWRLHEAAFDHLQESDGLVNNKVRCLLSTRDGALWIGTEGGLSRLKNGTFTNFTTKNGLAHNWVRALCEDKEGNVRAATVRGLSRIDAERGISTINIGTNATANSLKGVCLDRQGRIWVSSPEGITCLEEQSQKFFGTKEGLPSPIATALLADENEGVWAGTYNGVIHIAASKCLARPLNDAGFGDLINVIFRDREENLWVGARDGLYRIVPARFTAYTVQEGLACNNVMSVLEDKSGNMWFATWGGGLNEFRNGKFIVYGATNGLTHDKVLALHEDRQGALWIGMDHGGGLNRLESGSLSNSFPRQALFDTALRVIYEDQRGALWIGTSAGLHVYERGQFTTFNTSRGLAGNLVLSIIEDHRGAIWIGTDEGLSCWSEGKFTNYRTENGLSHNIVQAIYEDADESLWVATRNGLNRWRDGRFRKYSAREGLFSDDIYEIVADDFGYLWMSCRTGIFRARKSDFDALDRGLIKSVPCIGFGKNDGLPTVQCNGVAKPAAWKGRDGRLWFPTIRGVVAVESRVTMNEKSPPIRIEEVVVDRKRVHQALALSAGATASSPMVAGFGAAENPNGPSLKIAPGHGELEIHYTALSLQAPEKNRFKYRLDPVDSDWVDAGTRREAFYANVGPGNYQFRVIACNNDGVWNENAASLGLVFLPHFWQTAWFRIAVAAGVVAILAAGYRLRVARLREIETLRIQIAADLHDDVGARLTKVAMVTELVDRETPEQDRNKPQIRNISRTTGEVIRAMDEIVWTINPSNDTLDHLANYLFQHTQEYFQNTGVRCRLDFPASLPECRLSTEERHNLFMAVKEALNNVLKHSGATEVRVSLAVESGLVVISVKDNGTGFALDQAHSRGDGLRNMKQRLEKIGGRLAVESAAGQGTSVRMEAELL